MMKVTFFLLGACLVSAGISYHLADPEGIGVELGVAGGLLFLLSFALQQIENLRNKPKGVGR